MEMRTYDHTNIYIIDICTHFSLFANHKIVIFILDL